eukprot:TRINITY_DN336_c0_g1_i3.p1 TRINITY_DN336_c0_g1~~TRINITY_DN336_c0_g1_i3.p1  ORF type:complete len:909 (-),score=282.52 TRINITY_DN336_c0_g1_i3:107-2833(-)
MERDIEGKFETGIAVQDLVTTFSIANKRRSIHMIKSEVEQNDREVDELKIGELSIVEELESSNNNNNINNNNNNDDDGEYLDEWLDLSTIQAFNENLGRLVEDIGQQSLECVVSVNEINEFMIAAFEKANKREQQADQGQDEEKDGDLKELEMIKKKFMEKIQAAPKSCEELVKGVKDFITENKDFYDPEFDEEFYTLFAMLFVRAKKVEEAVSELIKLALVSVWSAQVEVASGEERLKVVTALQKRVGDVSLGLDSLHAAMSTITQAVKEEMDEEDEIEGDRLERAEDTDGEIDPLLNNREEEELTEKLSRHLEAVTTLIKQRPETRPVRDDRFKQAVMDVLAALKESQLENDTEVRNSIVAFLTCAKLLFYQGKGTITALNIQRSNVISFVQKHSASTRSLLEEPLISTPNHHIAKETNDNNNNNTTTTNNNNVSNNSAVVIVAPEPQYAHHLSKIPRSATSSTDSLIFSPDSEHQEEADVENLEKEISAHLVQINDYYSSERFSCPSSPSGSNPNSRSGSMKRRRKSKRKLDKKSIETHYLENSQKLVTAQKLIRRWYLRHRFRKCVRSVMMSAVFYEQRGRSAATKQIFQTEKQYRDQFGDFVNNFIKPLPKTDKKIREQSGLSKTEIQLMCFNIESIHKLSEKICDAMEEYFKDWPVKGDLFAKIFVEKLDEMSRLYEEYISRQHPLAIKYFSHCNLGDSRKIEQLLFLPSLRFARYKPLLTELFRQTSKDHLDFNNVKTALDQVVFINTKVENLREQKVIKDKVILVQNLFGVQLDPKNLIDDGAIEKYVQAKKTSKKNKKSKNENSNGYYGYIFNDRIFVTMMETQKDGSHKQRKVVSVKYSGCRVEEKKENETGVSLHGKEEMWSFKMKEKLEEKLREAIKNSCGAAGQVSPRSGLSIST